MSRTVLLSVSSAQRGAAYVAALEAAGVPARDVRIVVAGDPPGGPTGGVIDAGNFPGRPPAAAGNPPGGPPAGGLADLLQGAAGLVLGGGADVEPRRYGEEPLPAAGLELWPRRDELEWELLAAARERRLPVWGVCRGFQVLNVFLGGSLWQDLPAQWPGPVTVDHDRGEQPDLLAHTIEVLAAGAPLGERLAAAGPRPGVNSRHHQGVKRLAPGLLPVAAAPDGLIEAAVLTGDGAAAAAPAAAAAAGAGGREAGGREAGRREAGGWWVRGVAWHPENLIAMPEQLALWRDFAAAALGSPAAPANR